MVVRESIVRDIARLIIWYPLRWLVILLPIPWGIRLFCGLGNLHAILSRGRRIQLLDQYHLLVNHDVSATDCRFVQKYLANHYITQLSIISFPKLNQKNIGGIHSFSGLEYLEQAREQNRGAILLHAHFGPAQLTLVALGLLGYRMIQVGLPVDEGLSWVGKNVSFRYRLRYESKIPAKIIPANSYLRTVIKELQHNAVVMITGDGAGGGNYLGKFIPVNFLGKPLPFAAGAIRIAQKTLSPLLPTFIIPISKTEWQTIIHPPLNPDQTIEEQLAEFVAILEAYVLKYPASWHFWPEIADRIAYAEKLQKQ